MEGAVRRDRLTPEPVVQDDGRGVHDQAITFPRTLSMPSLGSLSHGTHRAELSLDLRGRASKWTTIGHQAGKIGMTQTAGRQEVGLQWASVWTRSWVHTPSLEVVFGPRQR